MMDLEEYNRIKSIKKKGILNTVTLSIVIPFYKNLKGLKRALNSLLSQKNKFYFNVIIVDDSDSDIIEHEVINLLNQIDTSLNIIYFKNEKNMRGYGNWRRCFELANGKYIMMLHQDDILLPDAVNQTISLFEKYTNIDAIYHNRIYTSKILENEIKVPNTRFKAFKNILKFKTINKVYPVDFIYGFCPIAQTGFAIRKKIIDQGFNFKLREVTFSGDTEYAIDLAKHYNLYFNETPLLVKIEEGENTGSDKNITIPVLYSIKDLFKKIDSNNLLKDFLINMQIAKKAKSFKILEQKEILKILPKYTHKKISKLIYTCIIKLNYYFNYKRRGY